MGTCNSRGRGRGREGGREGEGEEGLIERTKAMVMVIILQGFIYTHLIEETLLRRACMSSSKYTDRYIHLRRDGSPE